ncbi:MAG: hypothetical protein IJ795_02925 [Bacteroidales bacterium]|nr:hypothetical protein [Bacteroidales bacterium]
MVNKTALLIITALLACASPAFCQIQAGAVFSPKACGASLAIGMGRGVTEVRLCADLEKVLRGETPYPGVSASCFMEYNIYEWHPSEDLAIYYFAGPGAMAGYVVDSNLKRGVAAGLAAITGFSFAFTESHICITAGFSGVLGGHLTFTDTHENTLRLYKSGLRNAIMPELTVRYMF